MTSTVTPTSIPETHGKLTDRYDGRYRLYTVEHVPFSALPTYRDGGPATVVRPGWAKSTSSLCRLFSSASVVDDGMHTLGLRHNGERHALDGTKYATALCASRAAFEIGATAFMVYHRDGARFGLPTDTDND